MGEFVQVDVVDGVVTLRLSRPPVNAIDSRVQHELIDAAHELDSRADVAAVVVHGGERVFAAGADVKEMAAMSLDKMAAHSHLLQDFTRALAAIGKPTVSAITGFALGGGLEIALATDLRFCADDATLGQPEILLGIIPGAGGTQRLSRLVGTARAKDLIYSGRFVGADEALSIGLVDAVYPAADVHAAALAWARRFVGGPALALRAAKLAIDAGTEVGLEAGLEIERQAFAGLWGTRDQKAGMESFMAQGLGKADFEGR